MSTSNWITVSESQFPWVLGALEFVRQRFPQRDPYRAWSNFEFIADDGSVNEVDLLVLTPLGIFLIEIKSRPGLLRGDAGTWTWEHEGRQFTDDKRARQIHVGEIPVPPKYKSSDFRSSTCWRLRGKLDVPKERWGSFPRCEGEDQSLVIAWAGYDHLQLTKAVSAFFAEVQQTGGSEDPRLVPLLGCILELNPWVKQWHNDVDPDFGYRLGDYFVNFVEDEARTLGKTVEDIKAWQPPQKNSQKKKRTKKKAKSAND